MSRYSGAGWIETQLPYVKPGMQMSEFGRSVADLLGELFYGIYHLDHKALYRVDWSNERFIEFTLGWHQLATTDYDELTRLVFLAHHFSIRVAIEASTHKYLRLIFHKRDRGNSLSQDHPTLSEAVEAFQNSMADDQVVEKAS